MKVQKMSTLIALLGLVAACTPSGQPLGQASFVDAAQGLKTQEAPVKSDIIAQSLKDEAEASGIADTLSSAWAKLTGRKFESEVRIAVQKEWSSDTLSDKEGESKNEGTASGMCRIAEKNGVKFLYVEISEILRTSTLKIRTIEEKSETIKNFAFLAPFVGEQVEEQTSPFLIRYFNKNLSEDGVLIENPKTVTTSSLNLTIEREGTSDAVKVSGPFSIRAISQDGESKIQAEGSFSCDVDSSKVLKLD